MADEIDLDQRARDQEPGSADGRPRRRDLEILLPDLIEGVEVRKTSHEDLSLEHLVERAAGGRECLLEILENEARLLLDVRAVIRESGVLLRRGRYAGLEVACQLTGGKDQIADSERLGVVRERLRRRRLDRFAFDALPRHVTDQIDLHQSPRNQEPSGSDGGARRRHLEIVAPYLVEGIESVEVGHEDLGLNDMIERAAGGLERLLQVAEHVMRLQLDVGAVVRKRRIPAR